MKSVTLKTKHDIFTGFFSAPQAPFEAIDLKCSAILLLKLMLTFHVAVS